MVVITPALTRVRVASNSCSLGEESSMAPSMLKEGRSRRRRRAMAGLLL